jgi:hypothetical protein
MNNNLEKFEKDVVYLKHMQKIHIFPVDSVHKEENNVNSDYTETDTEIYNQYIKLQVLQCLKESSNLWVFSGGQTFSGKDESLFGNKLKGSVVYSAIQTIFKYIEKDEERDYILRISCFEIYNEQIHDLLAINSMSAKIKNTTIENIIEEVCSTVHEISALWNLSVNNKNNLNNKRKTKNSKNKDIDSSMVHLLR